MQQQNQTWVHKYWRPAMGWTYMLICLWDFIIAPIFFQGVGKAGLQWHPLTLESSGMFHTAMGVILGVAAWTRGQEKVAMMNFGGMSTYGGGYGNYGGGGYGGQQYGQQQYQRSTVTTRFNPVAPPQEPVNLPNRYD